MFNTLEKIQWGLKLQGLLDSTGVGENVSLKDYNYMGFYPNLRDKIPYTSEFCNLVRSLIILDTEAKRYIVVKARTSANNDRDIESFVQEFKDFEILRNIADIKDSHKFELKHVIIPIKYSELLKLSQK